jgi:hypothetical protein
MHIKTPVLESCCHSCTHSKNPYVVTHRTSNANSL